MNGCYLDGVLWSGQEECELVLIKGTEMIQEDPINLYFEECICLLESVIFLSLGITKGFQGPLS